MKTFSDIHLKFDMGYHQSPPKALYVNGILCTAQNNLISHCFQDQGNYQLTFQGSSTIKYTANNYTGYVWGMSFKVYEEYLCLPECVDCIEDQCCSSNYTIKGSSCTCSLSSQDNCECPFGYTLEYNDPTQETSSCYKISKNNNAIKTNLLKSQAGMKIICSNSGENTTAKSSEYSSYNDIPDVD